MDSRAGALPALGDGPRPRPCPARRPPGARSRRRRPRRGSRSGPRARLLAARRPARIPRAGTSPAPRLDAGGPHRGDPATLPRGTALGDSLEGDRPRRAGAGGARGRARRCPSLGPAAPPPVARPPHRPRARRRWRGLRRAPAGDELAARSRSRGDGADRPARRPAQRVDPGLGRPRAPAPAGATLPGPDLPSAARRARVLREPAPARGSGRALLPVGAAGARVQPGVAAQPARLGPGRLPARPARERRSPGCLRRRGRFRRGGAPLDAPRAPARPGDAVPALRPSRPRPLLGAADAAARAPRGSDARPPGPGLRVPRGDHRVRADGRGAGGPFRRPRRARLWSPGRRLPAGRRPPGPGGAALPADARVPGRRVHSRDGLDLRDHPHLLCRERHRILGPGQRSAARPRTRPTLSSRALGS